MHAYAHCIDQVCPLSARDSCSPHAFLIPKKPLLISFCLPLPFPVSEDFLLVFLQLTSVSISVRMCDICLSAHLPQWLTVTGPL